MAISKRQTTQYNHFCKVKSSVYELFSRTKSFQLSLEDFIKLKNKMYLDHPSLGKLNSYYKGNISGIEATLFHILQTEWVEWLHYYEDGDGVTHYVTKWEHLPEHIGSSMEFYRSNHFWKNPTDLNNRRMWGTDVA